MKDQEILAIACAHLGVAPESVASHHVYEDHIALVVNKGIAGCPKYKIPLETLTKEAEPHPQSVSEADQQPVTKPKKSRKKKSK